MMKLYHLTALAIIFAMLAAPVTPVHAASAIAFPGAEGFGAATVGGRGGRVYEVTNTNDSGPGSLRSCVEASGPRVCVFRTGGLITVSTTLHVRHPYITIAGQTAPGGGITIRATGGSDVFSTETSQVIMRYLSLRPGPGGSNHADEIASNGTALSNIILDHMTYSWAVDENTTTWYRVVNFTLQWSIISEALNCSTHPKGCHSKGLMLGGYAGSEDKNSKGSENISVLHNLMAHNGERAPLFEICGTAQVVNNVSYNPFWTFSHQQDNCYVPNGGSPFISRINWIGNYHKKGPDSTSSTDLKVIPADNGVYSGGAQVYVQGNIGPSRPSNARPDSDWVDAGSRNFIETTPARAPAVRTTDAFTAYAEVLNKAGNSRGLDCNGNWYTRRDAIDARVVNDVRNGTGHIIDDPSQVGGWIRPAPGTPCADSDHDGMPDAWEVKYGLEPASAADGPADTDGDGYTNLEEYLNGTDPAAQAPIETLIVTSDGADDGWVLESGENTNTGGVANALSSALVLGDTIARKQYRAFISFDTAALPDNASIQSVNLKIRRMGVVGPNPFSALGSILVDIRNGSFSRDEALQAEDFQAASSQNGAMVIRNAVSDGWYSASLSSRYFGAINVLGLTQFRLRFARDDNDDLLANDLRLYSGDDTVDPAYRPTLTIMYYVP